MSLNFRKRLQNGEVLIGTLITIPSPEVAEIMAETGFDWLFVDTEHGAFDAQEAQGILQAVDHRCPYVIRIPCNDEVWIKKAPGIFADSAESAAPFMQKGYRLIAIGTDALHMAQSAKATSKALKKC